MKPAFSIRGRLLWWQTGALAVTGLLVSLLTVAIAWEGFNQLRDFALEQVAHAILRHGVESAAGGGLADQGQFISQIWAEDGGLIYTSRPGRDLPRQAGGLRQIEALGRDWHVFTTVQDGLTIQVASSEARREAMFARMAPWLLLPFFLLLLVLGGLIWMVTGRALQPLEELRREVGARHPQNLSQLSLERLPAELEPLADTVNQLMARLAESLSAQRRFTADAAHELRTPLTAIRLHAQLAQRATTAQDRAEALEQLLAGVERSSQLVQQLLQLARLEQAAGGVSEIRLDELAREAVAAYLPRAQAKSMALRLEAAAPVRLLGADAALWSLLSNLLDNAVQYCPPGSGVTVRVRAEGPGAELVVSDTGPGIPAALHERALDRFYRIPGATGSGSGLGLAIAREAALRHGGTIRLQDAPGGGLLVRVLLPGWPQAPDQPGAA